MQFWRIPALKGSNLGFGWFGLRVRLRLGLRV